MKSLSFISSSPQETTAFARQLTRFLNPGDIICLFGNLGAGKTTFVKGVAEALKIFPAKVTSPTFVFLNIYEGKLPVYHFDLYRMEKTQDLGTIGYDEFLYGEGIAVVEWADKLGEFMPKEYVGVYLENVNDDQRKVTARPFGKRYEELMRKIDL